MKRYISMFLVALFVVPLLLVPVRAGTGDPNLFWPGTTENFSQTVNGVTLSYDALTQVYTLNGSSSAPSFFEFFDIDISDGSYVVSIFYVSGTTSNTVFSDSFRIYIFNSSGATISTLLYSSGSSSVSTAPFSISGGFLRARINSTYGASFNNLKFRVQLEKGSASAWKPWSPDIEPEPTYNLTVSAGSGGTVSGGSGSYEAGSTVNLSATPNTGYVFNGWSSSSGGSFGNASSASTTFITPANDTTVTASFRLEDVQPPEKYQLIVSGGTGGTASGSGSYESGSVVSISATPSTGYAFSGWSSSGGGSFGSSSAASTTFTMPANAVTVTAAFTVIQDPDPPGPEGNPNLWHSVDGYIGYFGGTRLDYDSVTQIYTLNGSVSSSGPFTGYLGELESPLLVGGYYSLTFDYISGSITSTHLYPFEIGIMAFNSYGATLFDDELFFSMISESLNANTFGRLRVVSDVVEYPTVYNDRQAFYLKLRGAATFDNLKFRLQLEKGPPTPWKPWVPPARNEDEIIVDIGDIGGDMSDWGNQVGSFENMAGEATGNVATAIASAQPIFMGVWNVLPAWVWMLLAVSLAIVIGRKIIGR